MVWVVFDGVVGGVGCWVVGEVEVGGGGKRRCVGGHFSYWLLFIVLVGVVVFCCVLLVRSAVGSVVFGGVTVWRVVVGLLFTGLWINQKGVKFVW